MGLTGVLKARFWQAKGKASNTINIKKTNGFFTTPPPKCFLITVAFPMPCKNLVFLGFV
jgi:hypothetical protein